MIIPYKYRERYDNLARSHPWMREMRDEQAPEGDAVEELREFIDDQFVSGKTAWTQGMAIADMVERECVSRKYLDEVRSEADYREGLLHESIDDLKAERDEKVSLLETAFKRCKELEVERDEWKTKLDAETKARNACARHAANMEAERAEWKAKAEQAQEIAYRWQRVVSDYADEIFDLEEEVGEWKAKAEQAERAMNAAAGKWAKADVENHELRKMLALDDGTIEEYTERADPSTALEHQKQLAEEWRDRCHNAEALCDKLESERDEWKAKAAQESAHVDRLMGAICDLARKQPYTFDPEAPYANAELVAKYIDELESKAKGSSKVRVGSSNFAKLFDESEWFAAMVRVSVAALMQQGEIDLDGKTIDEWLMSPHGTDGESDGNGTCPDANGTTSNDNREKPAKLYGKEVDQVILDELHDTREKLEADAEEFAKSWAYDDYVDEETLHEMYDECLSGVIELLDRQKAITEDDCTTRYAVSVWERDCEIDELRAENAEQKELLYDIGLENAEKRAAIAKLRAENDELRAASDGADVDRLQRENISLARDLGAAMRDRDELQSAYDELTRIAADLCRACGFSMVDASGEVVG